MNNIGQQYSYCKPEEFPHLSNILSSVFSINETLDLANAYNCFRDSFESTFDQADPLVKKENFKLITNDNSFLQDYMDINCTVGIDLPVIIRNEQHSNGKNIFIVGEDPLRNENHYVEITKNQQASLSTPYGLHLPKRRNRQGKLYWDFSLSLLNDGYSIYYTDFKKIWIKKRGSKSKLQMPLDIIEVFESCLKLEIETFNPSVIITFGEPAKISIQKFDLNIPVVHFIHPTFTARKHWKQLLNKNETSEEIKASNKNILQYMKKRFSLL